MQGELFVRLEELVVGRTYAVDWGREKGTGGDTMYPPEGECVFVHPKGFFATFRTREGIPFTVHRGAVLACGTRIREA